MADLTDLLTQEQFDAVEFAAGHFDTLASNAARRDNYDAADLFTEKAEQLRSIIGGKLP